MNSKRLNSDSKVSHALVLDSRTGEVYDVKTDSNKSCTGTYLNCEKISEEVVLQNGDLIAFKDQSKTWDFVYKFCLLSNPNKKLRLEERDSMLEEYEILKTTMEQLKDQLIEVEVARKKILDDCNAKVDELKKLVNSAMELNSNLKKKIIELEGYKQDSINETNMFRRKFMLQKELLDTKIAKEEESVEILKTQIKNLLENNFQCAICNEMIYRATMSNCAHGFCHVCIKSWLSRSNLCPICRASVTFTSFSYSVDNFISNICDLLGGTIKEQRLIQQSERNGHPPQVAERDRKMENQSSRSRREPLPFELIDDNPTRNNTRFPNRSNNVIEIVDLTNNTSR